MQIYSSIRASEFANYSSRVFSLPPSLLDNDASVPSMVFQEAREEKFVSNLEYYNMEDMLYSQERIGQYNQRHIQR